MTFGQGNPIVSRAIIKGLGREGEAAAEAREDGESRAALDEAELRELERAQFAMVASAVHVAPAAPRAARRRSLLDRLLGR